MMSCTAKGKDMSEQVFAAAIALAVDQDSIVVIGGGEPTLHPGFWNLLGIMFSQYTACWPEMPALVVTNGSNTEYSIALAGMARRGVLCAAVSVDQWHDPIHHSVVEAFSRDKARDCETDLREVRTVSRIIKAGRARKWGDREACGCDELFVDPGGKVWRCGCRKQQYGTVFAPAIPDDYENYSCSTYGDEN